MCNNFLVIFNIFQFFVLNNIDIFGQNNWNWIVFMKYYKKVAWFIRKLNGNVKLKSKCGVEFHSPYWFHHLLQFLKNYLFFRHFFCVLSEIQKSKFLIIEKWHFSIFCLHLKSSLGEIFLFQHWNKTHHFWFIWLIFHVNWFNFTSYKPFPFFGKWFDITFVLTPNK